MAKRVDDLSQENPLDSEPEDTSMAEDMMSAYAPKIGNYVKDSAKRTGRRMLWSLLLSFTLNQNEYRKDRMLDRLERGEKIGCFELFFGEKFTPFVILRWVIFLVIVVAIIVYVWQSGIIEQFREQQALLDTIQQTSTAP